MDVQTIVIFSIMYIYGFTLMIWAIYFDKHPTKLSVNASIFGIIVLIASIFYCAYKLWTVGIL